MSFDNLIPSARLALAQSILSRWKKSFDSISKAFVSHRGTRMEGADLIGCEIRKGDEFDAGAVGALGGGDDKLTAAAWAVGDGILFALSGRREIFRF